MPPRYPPPEVCSNGVIPLPSNDIHCRAVPHVKKGKRDPRSVDRIALYHYVLRSKEDYNIKIERGGGDRKGRESHYMEYLKKIDRCVRRTAADHRSTLAVVAEPRYPTSMSNRYSVSWLFATKFTTEQLTSSLIP